MNKYKILLLGLMPIALGFGFSNAQNICTNGVFEGIEDPINIPNNAGNNININFSNSCNGEITAYVSFYGEDQGDMLGDELDINIPGSITIPEGANYYRVGIEEGSCERNTECTISYNFSTNNSGGGDDNTGGGSEGGNTGGGIVSGGINAFSGIIDRLGNIFGEFGPYILYIALACLGISLLFKALKSLLGFTDNKAKNSIGGRAGMKDRRRRRRQQRRKTYSQNDVNNAQYKSDYYYIGRGRYKKRTIQRRKKFGGTLKSFNQSKR